MGYFEGDSVREQVPISKSDDKVQLAQLILEETRRPILRRQGPGAEDESSSGSKQGDPRNGEQRQLDNYLRRDEQRKLNESLNRQGPQRLNREEADAIRRPKPPRDSRNDDSNTGYQIPDEVKLDMLAQRIGVERPDAISIMSKLSSKAESDMRNAAGPGANDAAALDKYIDGNLTWLKQNGLMTENLKRDYDLNDPAQRSEAKAVQKENIRKILGASDDRDLFKRLAHNLASDVFAKAGLQAPSYEQMKK